MNRRTGSGRVVTRRAFLVASGATVAAWGCASDPPEEDVMEDEPDADDEEAPLDEDDVPDDEEDLRPDPSDEDITGAEGPVDAVIVDADVPTGAAIFGWVNEMVDLGVRRPGYDGDEQGEEWAVAQFEAAGLERVGKDPVTVTRWEPVTWSLQVRVGSEDTVELSCFPMAHSPGLTTTVLDLVLADPTDADAVEGRAVLRPLRLEDTAVDAVLDEGSVPADVTGRTVDPDDSLAGQRQVLPLGLAAAATADGGAWEVLATSGADLVIGWLDGHPDDTHEIYAPYGDEELPLPGLWVGRSDGAWLRRQLAGADVEVTVGIEVTSRRTVVNNVVGELPGADDQTVMITSHHDAPWASAVEDASGAALVLAQARYWAAQPVGRRPHRLVFVLHSGQVAGGVGMRRYIRDHRGEMDDVVLQVSLEQAALEVEEQEDGDATVTDRPVPRWFFTSRVPRLESAVLDALTTEEVHRSLLLAPNALGDGLPTAGAAYADEGVPVVHFASAPAYLGAATDAVDRVDQDGLAPLTRAVVRIVASTAGIGAAALRVGSHPLFGQRNRRW